MTRKILIRGGQVALVDDADYERLAQHTWYLSNGYAIRREGQRPNRTTVRMHRDVLRVAAGVLVDHINRNRLDNRRANLRTASAAENTANVGLTSKNNSGYKGVCRPTGESKWVAQIQVDGVDHYLGRFVTALDAAYAYDDAARRLVGEFAQTNFPAPPSSDYQPTAHPTFTRTCKVCGKRWESWHPRRTMCSDECRAEEHRQRQRRLKVARTGLMQE